VQPDATSGSSAISRHTERVRRSLVPVALVLAVLGGCTTAGSRDAAPTTTPDRSPSPDPVAEITTLACDGPIDGGPPPADYETVLGVVALPTGEAIGASDSGDPTVPALFAKTGLLVRAGQSFELVAAEQPDNRVAIGWGNVASDPSPHVVVPACADTYGTGWLVYPGGYWADRPLCLPLTVRADAHEEQVRIGVGTACP
jgi:hypothetical protein